jgi:iron(III) transport system substrate-binding protein
MVGNMARPPKGGDTDQIKAVASGECAVALTNSYYLARMMRSQAPADRDVVERIGVVFPNQADHGTHVNVAGGAVARYAKNRASAVQFLEYLSSAEAQGYFADGNNEWPVVSDTRLSNPALATLGKFKAESVPISVIGMNQVKVQQILDRVGYK